MALNFKRMKTNTIFFFVICAILFANNPILVTAQVSAEDFEALRQLYLATDGDNWFNNSGWDLNNNTVADWNDETGEGWYGISVDETTGRIYRIHLINNNLKGEIPPEIGNLTYLSELVLQQNRLEGEVPDEVANLSILTVLHLFQNQLEGEILQKITSLTKLESLQIFENKFTGNIPTEINNMIVMTKLLLSDNQFSGTLPSELGDLSYVEVISIANNNFTGTIPTELTELSELSNLNISGNEFDVLPDFSTTPELLNFRVEKNLLTFDQLEPNAGKLTSYTPQNVLIDIATNETTVSEDETLTIEIITGGTENRYNCYLNGQPKALNLTNATYTKNNFHKNDAGLYSFNVTNTKITGLSIPTENVLVHYNDAPKFGTPITNGKQDELYSYNITITDADTPGSKIAITCTQKPSWLTFTNNRDGTATLTGTPTNEDVGSFPIEIQADDGIITIIRKQNFTLNIENVNDAPTDLTLDNNQIAENTSAPGFIGSLTTQDIDQKHGDTPNYTFTKGESFFFTIQNGKLLANASLDFEDKNIYTFTIRATDQGGKSIQRDFTIHVTDVNDAPHDLTLSPNNIAENEPKGSIVGVFYTQDQDNTTHTYSLKRGNGINDVDNNSFTIDGNALKLSESPDYEIKPYYEIYVSTSDGALDYPRAFTVEIDNVNDNPVFFTPPVYTFHIPEQMLVDAGDVSVTDADNLPVQFTINDFSSVFSINSDGVITVTDVSVTDYETTKSFLLPIHVTDGLYSDNGEALIIIENRNDNTPVFDVPVYTFSVVENTPDGIIIGNVHASDIDNLLPVEYSVTPVSAPFTILNDGSIAVADSAALDFETNPQINFTANAFDGDNTGKANIIVTLKNINDPPTMKPIQDRTIAEDAGIQTVILQDIDDGDPFASQNITIDVSCNNTTLIPIPQLQYIPNRTSGTITYSPKNNASGTATVTIALHDDGGTENGGVDTRFFHFDISVTPYNDPPVLHSPEPIVTKESLETIIPFVSIEDPDTGNKKIYVEMYAVWGMINIKKTAILDFTTGDGSDDDMIKFYATLDQANIALNNFTYTSRKDYYGSDMIHIFVSDEGNTGVDGKKTDFIDIPLTIQPIPAEIISENLPPKACIGENLTLNVDAIGTALEYQWTKNGREIYGADEAQYIITKVDEEDAGIYACEVSNQWNAVTTTAQKLEVKSLTLSLNRQHINCFGENTGSITVTAGGGFASYLYSKDGINFKTENKFENLNAGTYKIHVKDANQCIISDETILIQPNSPLKLTLTSTNVSCKNFGDGLIIAKAEGGAQGYSYEFNGENVNTQTRFENLVPSSYSIKVIDRNGCSEAKQTSITEPDRSLTMSVLSSDVLCHDQPDGIVAIKVDGGTVPYTINWRQKPFTTGTIQANLAGVYSITQDGGPGTFSGEYLIDIEDANGCETNSTTIISQPDPIEIEVQETVDEDCGNFQQGEVRFLATGGASNFLYSVDGINYKSRGEFTNLNQGNYTLFAKDANNCIEKTNVRIDAKTFTPVADYHFFFTLEGIKFYNDSQFADSCMWIFGDGSNSGWLHYIYDGPWFREYLFRYDTIGLYQTKIVVANRCGRDTATQMLNNTITYPSAINDNISKPVKIKLYPNPSTGKIFLELTTTSKFYANVEMNVFTALQKKIISKKIIARNSKILEVDLSNYPAGIYFIECRYRNHLMSKKVVIE